MYAWNGFTISGGSLRWKTHAVKFPVPRLWCLLRQHWSLGFEACCCCLLLFWSGHSSDGSTIYTCIYIYKLATKGYIYTHIYYIYICIVYTSIHRYGPEAFTLAKRWCFLVFFSTIPVVAPPMVVDPTFVHKPCITRKRGWSIWYCYEPLLNGAGKIWGTYGENGTWNAGTQWIFMWTSLLIADDRMVYLIAKPVWRFAKIRVAMGTMGFAKKLWFWMIISLGIALSCGDGVSAVFRTVRNHHCQ